MSQSQKSFKGPTYKCPHCHDLIFSSYSGEFVSCSCKKCFVDSTRHYTRVGGNATYVKEDNE